MITNLKAKPTFGSNRYLFKAFQKLVKKGNLEHRRLEASITSNIGDPNFCVHRTSAIRTFVYIEHRRSNFSVHQTSAIRKFRTPECIEHRRSELSITSNIDDRNLALHRTSTIGSLAMYIDHRRSNIGSYHYIEHRRSELFRTSNIDDRNLALLYIERRRSEVSIHRTCGLFNSL